MQHGSHGSWRALQERGLVYRMIGSLLEEGQRLSQAEVRAALFGWKQAVQPGNRAWCWRLRQPCVRTCDMPHVMCVRVCVLECAVHRPPYARCCCCMQEVLLTYRISVLEIYKTMSDLLAEGDSSPHINITTGAVEGLKKEKIESGKCTAPATLEQLRGVHACLWPSSSKRPNTMSRGLCPLVVHSRSG